MSERGVDQEIAADLMGKYFDVKDNALYRYIRPKLQSVKLGWVDFQVMRRTYSTLLRERGVDPKIVADLMGHDVDVNLNTYTQTSLESRFEAVKVLESTLIN